MLALLLCLVSNALAEAHNEASGAFLPGEVLVKFRSSVAPVNGSIAHSLPGAKVKETFSRIGWHLVTLPDEISVPEALKRLRKSKDTSAAEPNYRVKLAAAPPNAKLSEPWSLTKIGAPQAWAQAGNEPKVVVGIIDTGVNYRHPDLAANIWRNPGEIDGNGIDDDQNGHIDDVLGIDLADGDSDPMDDEGHGSHIAGIIAGVRDNGIGVTGVSPQAQILAIRAFSLDGITGTEDVIKAFEYAIALRKSGVNLRVLNCSWGAETPSLAEKDAVTAAVEAGILIVCGSGNDHQDNDFKPFFPAAFDGPGIISVAASTEADEPALFTNYGETTVHLAAPGHRIYSTYKGGPDYATISGTSMATPHVSGAAALLLTKRSDLTVAALKSLLIQTADRLPSWTGKVTSGGRLNVAKAMEIATTVTDLNPSDRRPAPKLPSTLGVVSRNSQGAMGNQDSDTASISGDGRYVVFTSGATNLVPDDTNDARDVFLHDRVDKTTTRISQTAGGGQADDESGSPTISEDGNHVVFDSWATNLVPGDTNDSLDVFLYHRLTGQLELVSAAPDGNPADDVSGQGVVSADGRLVAFASRASNLVPDDANGFQDIFLRDMFEKTTLRLSVGLGGIESDGTSDWPAISRDGRFVVFDSDGTTLSPNDRNNSFDLFVYDRDTQQLELISKSSAGVRANSDSGFASISGDGRFVAFESWASNLETGDNNLAADIYLRDRQLGTTRRISVSNTRIASDASSFSPSLSADGRFVAFESRANSLMPGDGDLTSDIFLYDRNASKLSKMSYSGIGAAAREDCFLPRLSADGRHVVFDSQAFNLVAGDGNAAGDVFVLDRSDAPADLQIRNQGESVFAGNGLIGPKVAQRKSRSISLGTATVYELKIDNAGLSEKTFLVSAAGIGPGWKADCYDAWTEGRSITSEMLGAGWRTPPVAPGSNIVFRLQVTAPDSPIHERVTDIEVRVSPTNGAPALDAVHAITLRPFSPPDRFCASRALDGAPGNDNSSAPALSADGRYVAFSSESSTLVAGDFNLFSDVFLFDRVPQRTIRASRAADGSQANGPSGAPSISNDGRYVAFQSGASNLVPQDTNNRQDIFVKDWTSGAIQRVSVSTGRAEASRGSQRPMISGNGQFVVFESLASNLTGRDLNRNWDVFVHNRTNGQTLCLSVTPNGGTGNADSLAPSISGDGRYIAFQSYADNLVLRDINGESDVFVYDLTTRSLELISAAPTGETADGSSSGASISADGRFVLFRSTASNLAPGSTNSDSNILLYDRTKHLMKRIGGLLPGFGHTLSPEGRWIGFTTDAPSRLLNQTSRFSGVFLYNLQTESLTQASATRSAEPGNDHSESVAFNADGRYVAFDSWAPNLLVEASPEASQIFVLDRALFQPDESIGRDGELSQRGRNIFSVEGQATEQILEPGTSKVFQAILQNSGTFPDRFFVTATPSTDIWEVRFSEAATGSDITAQITGGGWGTSELAPGETRELRVVVTARSPVTPTNELSQTIVLKVNSLNDSAKSDSVEIIGRLDADADGLPDFWELRNFNSLLTANDISDTDQDGVPDRFEYIAGTDPADVRSLLRILRLQTNSGNQLTIHWKSEPGRYYTLERASRVEGPYEKIAGNIFATPPENATSDILPQLGRSYFYRLQVERP
jgi:subtilisin family serine protease/Tol biopolymer transport system component